MQKHDDRRPPPSRRDVMRVAEPGSLIVVYDDLVILVVAWSYRILPGAYAPYGSEPTPEHYCDALLFDPKDIARSSGKNNSRVHPVHWTTISNWIFDQNNDIISEIIRASDPER